MNRSKRSRVDGASCGFALKACSVMSGNATSAMCARRSRRRGTSLYSAKPGGGGIGPAYDHSPSTAPEIVPIAINRPCQTVTETAVCVTDASVL
jgi:hypothetical protein